MKKDFIFQVRWYFSASFAFYFQVSHICTYIYIYKNKLYKNNKAEIGRKKEQIQNILRPTFIKFGKYVARWVNSGKQAFIVVSQSSLKKLKYLLNNCLFQCWNKLFIRQVTGLPMESDPAMSFANLFCFHYYESK